MNTFRHTLLPAVALVLAATCAALVIHVGGAASAGTAPHRAALVDYQLVRIGDAGNAADLAGSGAVAGEFSIGKYEVTIGQYTAFLNAVAAADPYSLYNPAMAEALAVAGIERSGSSGSYSYQVMQNSGSSAARPITFVSWFDAARFANWMSNGQPSGAETTATTEDGAYPLAGATSGTAPALNAVNPNTGAAPSYALPTEAEWYKAGYYDPGAAGSAAGGVPAATDPARAGLFAEAPALNAVNPNTGKAPAYFIPTEDQWYKAAYYDPALNGGAGGYYAYPTQSDQRPGNQPGSLPNQANYLDGVYSATQTADFRFDAPSITEVGAFSASPSHYGTFDQAGNLFEWNDLDRTPAVVRGFRGGSWQTSGQASDLDSLARWDYTPMDSCNVVGFRLAGTPATASDAGAGARRGDPVDLRMLVVGDPGNEADSTGFGAVAAPFAIGKYEVTIGQYTAFLNAVAASDPHDLYSGFVASQTYVAGIRRSGKDGAYHYAVMRVHGSSARRPVSFVSWFCAARFANWMSNGQPRGRQTARTTENGAYDLRKTRWVGSPRGYWAFPTRSDAIPGNLMGDRPDQANYQTENRKFSVTQSPVSSPTQNYLTDVGVFTSSGSHYGTFDQLGNVYEWNDLDGAGGRARGVRGACWFSGSVPAWDISKVDRSSCDPAYEAGSLGFRLAVRSAD